MFDRVSLKSAAKAQLKGNWSSALLVTLVQLFIDMIFGAAYKTTESTLVSLLCVLVSGILTIAAAYFYLAYKNSTPETRPDFQVFIKGMENWFAGILNFLWLMLWVFLWALLFIVPGIIKIIAYSQMFYITAENPDIDCRQAMKMSIKMTQGFKADLCVLFLSFFGWILLSALTCGVLFIWVLPYMNLTFAHTYAYLKETALRNGTLVEDDFKPAQKDTN